MRRSWLYTGTYKALQRTPRAPQIKQDNTPTNISDYWNQGIHISSDGKQYNLAELPASYLQNIINKFSGQGVDTTTLQSYIK